MGFVGGVVVDFQMVYLEDPLVGVLIVSGYIDSTEISVGSVTSPVTFPADIVISLGCVVDVSISVCPASWNTSVDFSMISVFIVS